MRLNGRKWKTLVQSSYEIAKGLVFLNILYIKT